MLGAELILLCKWKDRLISAAAAGDNGSHRAADVELVQRGEQESLAIAFVACIASDDKAGGLLLAILPAVVVVVDGSLSK